MGAQSTQLVRPADLVIPIAVLVRQRVALRQFLVPMCGTVGHAVKAAAAGCDAVIAQGTEGGGHTGKVASAALWPQCVDAVDVPSMCRRSMRGRLTWPPHQPCTGP